MTKFIAGTSTHSPYTRQYWNFGLASGDMTDMEYGNMTNATFEIDQDATPLGKVTLFAGNGNLRGMQFFDQAGLLLSTLGDT